MHIRPAEFKDTPELIRLGKQLLDLHVEFDGDYYQLEDNFDELFGKWIKEQMNTSSTFLLLAEEKNPTTKIVGFISGFTKALYPWFRTKMVGHISYMVVEPGFRRRGIGRLLEQAVASLFKSKNISFVEVYVEEKNPIAQTAWSSYGFQPFKKFLRKKI